MCGIVGYFDFMCSGYSLDSISFGNIVDSLVHRGPDARGTYQCDGLGLGHRRLSIIDVDKRSDQPMFAENEKVAIVYNGEIYNHQELRLKLERQGYSFKTTSDTEVLLNAYLAYGRKCTDLLNGMFSFAIFDYRDQSLWLVRDQVGIKPLFWAEQRGVFYFASEIQALLRFPEIQRDWDYYGVDDFFTFGYIPAPRTEYRNVKQIMPGEACIVKDGGSSFYTYWDLPLNAQKITLKEEDAISEFDGLLENAVKRQMISDVPLGAFLSGGLDSFAIARAMKKIDAGSVQAFSIGFENSCYDELAYAEQAADSLGIRLNSKRVRFDDETLIETVSGWGGDLFADSSSLPMYKLCEEASRELKVVLSGDGADELLGGYPLYKIGAMADCFRVLPDFVRKGFVRPLASLLPDSGNKYTLREKALRFIDGANNGRWRDHASWRTIIPPNLKENLYTADFKQELLDYDPYDDYVRYIKKAKSAGLGDLDALLYADFKFYLPNDMLVKVDRMSMANSLEVRVPFLDREVVNFAWALPEALKIKGRSSKYILRQVVSDTMPSELNRLPKSGLNMAPYENFVKVKKFHSLLKDDYDAKAYGQYGNFLIQYSLYVFGKISQLQIKG